MVMVVTLIPAMTLIFELMMRSRYHLLHSILSLQQTRAKFRLRILPMTNTKRTTLGRLHQLLLTMTFPSRTRRSGMANRDRNFGEVRG